MRDPETVERIEEMRAERGIAKMSMSVVLGYESTSAYGVGVRKGCIAPEKRERAFRVFEYYDENGYLPTPEEVW